MEIGLAIVVVLLYFLLRRGDKIVEEVKEMVEEQGDDASPEAVEFVEKYGGSHKILQWLLYGILVVGVIGLLLLAALGGALGNLK